MSAAYLDSSRTEQLDTIDQDGRNRPAWMRLVPHSRRTATPRERSDGLAGGFALGASVCVYIFDRSLRALECVEERRRHLATDVSLSECSAKAWARQATRGRADKFRHDETVALV